MVLFVHKDAGRKTSKSFVDFDTVLVNCFNFNFFGPWDRSIEVRDGETAFESGALGSATEGGLFTLVYDFGVEINTNFFF